jgi:heme-degrading monooxygenase HmoA
MFAHVVTAQIAPGKVEAIVHVVRDQLSAADVHGGGHKGFYLLADREAGRLVTISLWDSREAAQQADSAASQTRADTAERIGMTAPVTEILEVVMHVAARSLLMDDGLR